MQNGGEHTQKQSSPFRVMVTWKIVETNMHIDLLCFYLQFFPFRDHQKFMVYILMSLMYSPVCKVKCLAPVLPKVSSCQVLAVMDCAILDLGDSDRISNSLAHIP